MEAKAHRPEVYDELFWTPFRPAPERKALYYRKKVAQLCTEKE